MKIRRTNGTIYLFIIMVWIIFNYSIIYGADLYDSDRIEENANKLGYQQGIIKAYENNSKRISEPYYIAWPREVSEIIKEYRYAYDDYEAKYEGLIEISYKEGFKIGYNEIIEGQNREAKDEGEQKLTMLMN